MTHRYDFASDNTAGVCPEAWQALEEANRGFAVSYGADHWTERACDLVRQIFECECEVFFVFNGTAANALSLAHLCRPYHAVLCHEHAHIHTDECAAPELFSGGAKLIPIGGSHGKLDVNAIDAAIGLKRDVHSSKPRVISITQATEFGTVYRPNELLTVVEFARERSLRLHMDGARFANAIAALGCTPRSITTEIGIDVLSLGGTKNGTAVGDLVVIFDKEVAIEFDYRAKQGAQLASKMRFLAAPWCALLENDLWLKNARHANEMARYLATKLTELPGVQLAFPQEASAVFVHMSNMAVRQLHARGWHFYKFMEPDVYRLMCSWATTRDSVDMFVEDAKVAVTMVD